jgi:U3 small nucleolar RNA-associated protein 14
MGRRGKTKSQPAAQAEQPTPRIVEEITESDDEEIPEDEAFNSEDERLYGHFFEGGDDDDDEDGDEDDDEVTSGSDNDDDEDDEEEEEDDDGGQYMLDLLNRLDENNNNNNANANEDGRLSLAQMVKIPESDYSKSISKTGGLTLDSLMEGIQDTKGFKDLQKSLASKPSTTPAPLDKKLSSRTERKMTYVARSKDVSRWVEAIQENRKAESLDFKPKEKTTLTKDILVDKFEAKTNFEKEIEQALEEAGQQDEEAVLRKEEQALQDDLGANKLTMEEYKKRRGQLAQIRALMFYHERKRHQMKKIKSKKYRKIRKKQRDKLKESAIESAMEQDEDLAQELKEKEEVARIQERMTLAHKNTSKWAKRILKRGKNVDIDTRRALSAQLKRGDDLRRKMMGSDDDEDSDDDDENEDLVESARKVLQDIDDDSDPTNGKTGLFKLSFMQKGVQKQREQAREEARKLLGELEANDEIDDYDEMEQEEKEHEAEAKTAVSAKEMSKVLEKGELVASSLAFGNSNAIATSNGIEIDLDIGNNDNDDEGESENNPATTTNSEYVADMKFEKDPKTPSGFQSKEKKPAKASVAPTRKRTIVEDGDEANPWMQTANTDTVSKAKRKGVIDVEGATDILDREDAPKTAAATSITTTTTTSTNTKITSLTQEELVRRAFVSQDEKEVEEEFQKEKEGVVAENDPTRKVPKDKKALDDVVGWGSWTGQGAPPPRPRKLPKKLQAPKKKKETTGKRRGDEYKPDVILNKKRLKKTANTYMLADVPQPYSSRAEFEQAMLGAVGQEWNVSSSFKNMTRPEILTRAGKIIQPISKKAKQPRPAAKF